MEERFEHSLLTPSIPSGLRRSWENPKEKVHGFSDGTVCNINIWHLEELTPCWNHLRKSHYNFFIIHLIIWCHCWSDTKNNHQASTYHFQVFRHRGSGWDLFFLAGFLMFSSWWWWQDQNPLFTDVEHAGLVWASCVVFFFSPFVNMSGMHLNHVAVLLSLYEPV